MKLSATAFFYTQPPSMQFSENERNWSIDFLPTFEELYQKRFCFVSDIAGILNWVAAPPTSVGLATHSTLVTVSKTRKLRFYFHTKDFQGLYLLHQFMVKTTFMVEPALICLKRRNCILQPWLSGGRERAELLICLPRLTKPRGSRNGKSQGQGQNPAAPCVMGTAKPLTQLYAELQLQIAPSCSQGRCHVRANSCKSLH